MRPPLSPDQEFGAEFLAARPVAMLADKAGFGKCAQFVRAADMLGADAITILCPPVLRPTEAAEYNKWSLFRDPVAIIRGGKDEVPAKGVVVCSYKLAAENERIKKALIRRRPRVLILDEAHNVKDPASVRARALANAGGIASTAGAIWFVTATPTPNHAGEMYMFARAAGTFRGTYNQFLDRYCEMLQPPDPADAMAWFRYAKSVGSWQADLASFLAEFYIPADGKHVPKRIGALRRLQRNKVTGSKNVDELKAVLGPYILARNKADPGRAPLTSDVIFVDGDRPDFSGVPPDTLEAIEAALEAGDWRILDGPAVATVRRHLGVAKAKAVADLAAVELEGGHEKMIIFAHHTSVIDTIANKLGSVAAIIDGRTPAKLREELIAEKGLFQASPWPRVLICQDQALKEGVTLHRATRVIGMEPPWHADAWEQLYARAWRRGQTSPVHASRVYLRDSFDERIAAVYERKAADAKKILISSD